jgi:hypothetical protein
MFLAFALTPQAPTLYSPSIVSQSSGAAPITDTICGVEEAR